MKHILFIWLSTILTTYGFSGVSISPVVIRVFDLDGNPVAGASVEIKNNGLAEIVKNALDKESYMAGLAKKADGKRTTDALGHAVMYCGGGYLPLEDGKTKHSLAGEVVVTAKGYETTTVKFRRILTSQKEEATNVILSVRVQLKPEKKEKD